MDPLEELVREAWQIFVSSEFYAVATAVPAQRIYLLVGCLLLSILAVWTARKPLRALHDETGLENLIKRLRIPGISPTLDRTIEAQKQRKLDHAKAYTANSIRRIIFTFVLGVGVPFAAVLVITMQGDWLFPGAPVLIDAISRAHIRHRSLPQGRAQ
jgi:hypothetical protein